MSSAVKRHAVNQNLRTHDTHCKSSMLVQDSQCAGEPRVVYCGSSFNCTDKLNEV